MLSVPDQAKTTRYSRCSTRRQAPGVDERWKGERRCCGDQRCTVRRITTIPSSLCCALLSHPSHEDSTYIKSMLIPGMTCLRKCHVLRGLGKSLALISLKRIDSREEERLLQMRMVNISIIIIITESYNIE